MSVAVAAIARGVEARDPGTAGTAGLAPPRLRRRRSRPGWATAALRLSGPVGLLLLWWIGSRMGWISETILSPPGDVLQRAGELIDSGALWYHSSRSLQRAATGAVIGISIGLVLGIIAGLTRAGDDVIDPPMQMFRTIPFLALVPLFIVWFGIGELTKTLLIIKAAMFPMYLNTYGGMRNVDRKVVEAADVFGLGRLRKVREVIVPMALPSMMVGLRLSLTVSLVALIAVEQFNTSRGIGYLMYRARELFDTDTLVVCIVLYALMGLVVEFGVRGSERLLLPWRRTTAVRG